MLNSAVVAGCGCGPQWNGECPCQPPTGHLIPTTGVPLPCRSPLLNHCCVFFMTSNRLVKESAAMRVHPARAAPPLEPNDRMAPPQLWNSLSVGQPQHVRQVRIGVAQPLRAHLPRPPRTEEATHAPRSQPEP